MDMPLAFTWSWTGIDLAAIDPSTVTVSRDPCGRWYVSLAVDVPDLDPLPATGRVVGVDLGITDFAVTSDGQRIANPRHLERRARNLARYQRRMARCQPRSANRAKAKGKVARAHRKVRAARTDFLHKASTRLVRDHDVIAIEDLIVTNMVRNRRLAKAISDCGWGTFREMLAYKAARHGRRVIVADRWSPVVQDVLGVRLCPRRPEFEDPDVAVPILRYPARPGPQRREEHPGGRSCRSRGQPPRPCLRSWHQTLRALPGAAGRETGTPAREGRNPRPSGQGVVKPPAPAGPCSPVRRCGAGAG
jgi:IS605 OrfB family transposase